MDNIELNCPSCGEQLEIDSGFAGGVCRCFACGSLMTVPADPSRERVETLTRPDRPDAPGSPGRPGAPGQIPQTAGIDEAVSDAPTRPMPSAPGAHSSVPDMIRPDAPVSEDVATDGTEGVEMESDTQTFTTASGRVVHVKSGAIPVARGKRKAMRAGIYAAFAALVIVAVVGVFLAIQFVSDTAPGATTPEDDDVIEQRIKQAQGITAVETNPYLMTRANVFSLTLGDNAAVLVDGSRPATALYEAEEMIKATLPHLGSEQKLQVIVYHEQGITAYPEDKPASLDESRRAELSEMLTMGPIGVAEPVAAVEHALAGGATHLVLVTASQPSPDAIKALGDALDGAEQDVKFDVIFIGEMESGLEATATTHKGKVLIFRESQLRDWKQSYDMRQFEEAHNPG